MLDDARVFFDRGSRFEVHNGVCETLAARDPSSSSPFRARRIRVQGQGRALGVREEAKVRPGRETSPTPFVCFPTRHRAAMSTKKREKAEALLGAAKGPLSKAIGECKATDLPLKGGP